MKKEKQEIATNVSSGAEKVEVIEKEVKKRGNTTTKKTESKTVKTAKKPATTAKKTAAKGEAALGFDEKISAKKVNSESSGSKAEQESARAKARVEAALKRKEAQAKRKEERAKKVAAKKEARAKRVSKWKEMIEKRSAARKEAIEKRAAAKKAAAEKRAEEKEKSQRERAHKKANRKQAQSRKKSERQSRAQERKERSKGYGGWIAAVVSLGVVTLALTTAVTVGAIDMERTKSGVYMSQRGTMYELTGIMEHVDDDLERARISNTPAQQERILTDLLVQARLAELDLEKLPVSGEADRNITTFINRTAAESERMLGKLRRGETLSDEDFATLERLYKTNHSIRTELDRLVGEMTDKDLMKLLKNGKGKVGEALQGLENMTLEENRSVLDKSKDKMAGAGMDSKPVPQPFEEENKVDSTRAEELCKRYFSDYKITEFRCVGETVSHNVAAYNVQGYDDKGTLLFAEIDQKSGALLRFDYYEDCKDETFDLQNAERIAEVFLEKMGYDDMEVVRFRENGTMTDFTFVYEDDDVAYYPDEIRVKVCRTRGVVTGMDATKYLQNHRGRGEPNVEISLSDAQAKLHKNLEVESSRLAVVGAMHGERAAYEFLCSYGEEKYFVYIDAVSGNEISIINARAIS